MPGTINGIGTHYYGKRNHSTRQGYCANCKTRVKLESYDTRLWFVVLFIPIVPLGRKRVIDECPICTIHLSVDAEKLALQVRAAEAEARAALHHANPTPESARDVHASLLAMQQHDTAEKFRIEALKLFPDNAELISGLADQLDNLGDPAAIDLYHRAVELQPDIPSARIGVARQKIAEKKLYDARALLDFLERPGAGAEYNLTTLEELSRAYQTSGSHREALDLATVLLREKPEYAQHAGFRSFVRKSELALHSSDSILPTRRFSLKTLFFGGSEYSRMQRLGAWCTLMTSLAIVSLMTYNERIRRTRTLYLLNAFAKSAEVRIDGSDIINVQERAEAVLTEGRHNVQVSGPIEATYEIEMSSGYFERFSRSPFWAVNIGGVAALYEQTAVQNSGPIPPKQPEPKHFLGETFVHIPHVDYVFAMPASSISTRQGEIIHKTCVGIHSMMPADTVEWALKKNPMMAWTLAELALKPEQNDRRLLRLYGRFASADRSRLDRTLAAGLSRRPVLIEWHEMYLRNAVMLRDPQAVAQQYEDFLKAEPNNAALLYLRGRAEPDVNKRPHYYNRSINANFQMEWAHYALGVHHACRGEWTSAVKELNLASRLEVENMAEQARDLLHLAHLASGGMTEQGWTGKTGIARGTAYHFDLLRFTGRTQQALELGKSLKSSASPLPKQQDPLAEQNEIRKLETIQRAAYVLGQLEDSVIHARELTVRSPTETTNELLIGSIIANGKGLDEAARLLSERKLEDHQLWLAVGLAGALAVNKDVTAAELRTRAANLLKEDGGENAQAGELLISGVPPTIFQIESVALLPANRALLLATLAQFHPDKRDEYCAAARKWCIGYLPPNQTTRRLAGETR